MARTIHIPTEGQEAFCQTCPSPEEVAGFLQVQGLRLTFSMPAVSPRTCEQVTPLPAQFHYQDRQGTEVIYLCGLDADPDGAPLPDHASRFWAYPGSDTAAYRRITSVLTTRWCLRWRRVVPIGEDVA